MEEYIEAKFACLVSQSFFHRKTNFFTCLKLRSCMYCSFYSIKVIRVKFQLDSERLTKKFSKKRQIQFLPNRAHKGIIMQTYENFNVNRYVIKAFFNKSHIDTVIVVFSNFKSKLNLIVVPKGYIEVLQNLGNLKPKLSILLHSLV